MFDRIINSPSKNEHDVEIEKEKSKRIEYITNQLRTYADICLLPIREDGKKLMPLDGAFKIEICGEIIKFTRGF